MEIKPISIPRSLIRTIPPPITDSVEPPVTSSIEVPVLEVPDATIEYPTIDVPTREEFEGMIVPPQQTQEEEPEDSRDLPPPKPEPAATINVPVVGEVPLPPVAPLVTAGATAVVVASVTMTSTILLNQIKDRVISPMIEKMTKPKTKKIKIKQKKPVLHFVKTENGAQVFEYSVKGTRLVDTTDKIEQYLRDQVDIDPLYEFDNKIIVDDVLKESFTKEGAKRFKKLFVPAAAIVKKLSAKISF